MKQNEIPIGFQCARKKKKKRQNRREHSHKVIIERRQIGILTLIQRKVGPDHSLGKNKGKEFH